jgi:hypothetical protein
MDNPIIWMCQCGKLETLDAREAFQHRDKFGSNGHLVKPLRASELVRPEPTLTGIELRELEEMQMPIPLVKGGIR